MTSFQSEKRSHGDDDDDDMPTPSVLKRKRSYDNVPKDNTIHRNGHVVGVCLPNDYTVGWICVLPIEMAAARAMLDTVHESLLSIGDDSNAYILGNIAIHNIVIACLPLGHDGTNNAATVASKKRRSFPCIRISLMVGIGGGVPRKSDIRLGDVVVSEGAIRLGENR